MPKFAVAVAVSLASTVAVTDQPRSMVSLPVPFQVVCAVPRRRAYWWTSSAFQYAVGRALLIPFVHFTFDVTHELHVDTTFHLG
ncbi:hypothetical protein [Streptomyces sp. NPDC006368]|uniref:hypothetical protein n=1 Tax=Streptomyces sp. NPDC006368 TaxID=3156760 RepID=UPI0033B31493